jgi:2-C-methyl-D-erythritol 2,4-cyclodiphosphate synthase
MSYRVGFGVDFHQLAEGSKLWLGGVEIPHHKGAVGHSDADTLLHAICDALLGALNLGDIGNHFPDTDPQYKDVDSKILLKKTGEMVGQNHYEIVNIDSTVCLETPQIKNHIAEMRRVIASVLGIKKEDISIKATTTEQMGFVGREEGLAAYATVLVKKMDG